MNDQETIDKIAQIRVDNNKSWMTILKIAMKYAPKETKGVLVDITRADKEISKLCEELTK